MLMCKYTQLHILWFTEVKIQGVLMPLLSILLSLIFTGDGRGGYDVTHRVYCWLTWW